MSALSLRLKTIASLVPYGARVCDVGTDHARLPIFLEKEHIAKSIIATDLNRKPLEFAKKNIQKSGASAISLRLCDGLSDVKKGEADTVITAGMGGEVITAILKNCEWLKSDGITLILQPTTSPEVLRKFLTDNGFIIVKEIPVLENGKIYSVMLVHFSGEIKNYPDYFYYIGKIKPTGDGLIYIEKQKNRIKDYLNAENTNGFEEPLHRKYKAVLNDIEKLLTESENGI